MAARNLVLYEDIICGSDTDSGSGILRLCTSSVTKRDMEPSPQMYLSACTDPMSMSSFSIPAGAYLFIQGFLADGTNPFSADFTPAAELYRAAEELWLEFVWQEKDPADPSVYVRILEHEGDYTDKVTGQKKSAGLVFQLFRRVEQQN